VLEVTKKNNQIQTYRYFQWDDSGKPVGMVVKEKNGSGTWQTKPYYFWTNQRGDVTAIVDSSGAKVGAYTYDAFGNEQSETGDIAKSNPIRYAGYYYDTETKHDYLKARYYDPQNGNFLALDSYPGDDDDPVSQNGYTYAGNNSVMMVDADGDNPFYVAAAITIFIVYLGYRVYKILRPVIMRLIKRSTGRRSAHNLLEQLAMKEVRSNPLKGAKQIVSRSKMNDKRWPGKKGWVKMQRVIRTSKGKIVIHFNYNTRTHKFADFKFK